jgi:hypothetical protein
MPLLQIGEIRELTHPHFFESQEVALSDLAFELGDNYIAL